MTFSLFPLPSIAFSYLLVASVVSCIYTVPFSIERVLKLVLFMQYRLLSLPWTRAASPWKISLAIVDLVAIRFSSLNVFEVTCCISLDSKLCLNLCNPHLLQDKSRDLLWPIDKSRDVSYDQFQCPMPDTCLSSLVHWHDYQIRMTS